MVGQGLIRQPIQLTRTRVTLELQIPLGPIPFYPTRTMSANHRVPADADGATAGELYTVLSFVG